jgi:hypothetical protein
MDQENQESQEDRRAPETFADLSPERQRMWAQQQETQLFLAQLKADRLQHENGRDYALESNMEPGGRIAASEQAKVSILSYCINTIESAANAQ